MKIKKKVIISTTIIVFIVLITLGAMWFNDFTIPIDMVDRSYVTATMDLQIYLSHEIVLAKVIGDNESKTITYKAQTEKGEKTYKKLITDTQLEIKEVYKGDITKGASITYRGEYGVLNGLSRMDTSENPKFEKDEEYILFLQKDISSNTYYLTAGIQSKFVYDTKKKKYIAKHLEFEDINSEIERYNNTPEDERDLLGAGKGSINDI